MLAPEQYNYAHFDEFVASHEEERMFARFRDTLHAGERAPDGALTALDDGRLISLSELWAEQPVVLEFGSFT